MPIEWGRLRASELRSRAADDAIVIVPVASIEQHGPHLPVEVDTLLCTAIARRAAQRIGGGRSAVVTPPVWTGLAEHHMALGGTITLDFPVFFALLRCICRSLTRQGFRRIALLNGHGGNSSALNVVVDELTVELAAPIVTITYWMAAREAFAEILEEQTTVRHACEAAVRSAKDRQRCALSPTNSETSGRGTVLTSTRPASSTATAPWRWTVLAESRVKTCPLTTARSHGCGAPADRPLSVSMTGPLAIKLTGCLYKSATAISSGGAAEPPPRLAWPRVSVISRWSREGDLPGGL